MKPIVVSDNVTLPRWVKSSALVIALMLLAWMSWRSLSAAQWQVSYGAVLDSFGMVWHASINLFSLMPVSLYFLVCAGITIVIVKCGHIQLGSGFGSFALIGLLGLLSIRFDDNVANRCLGVSAESSGVYVESRMLLSPLSGSACNVGAEVADLHRSKPSSPGEFKTFLVRHPKLAVLAKKAKYVVDFASCESIMDRAKPYWHKDNGYAVLLNGVILRKAGCQFSRENIFTINIPN